MRKYKGFIAPQITKEHYIFGGGNVPLKTLQEDSDWTSLLPSEEQQNIRGIETFNCSAFGTTNAIELLMYKLTGERINYSDRWVGIIAGTKEPGNDPHVVAEAIRKYGLIPEEMLPFSDDIKTVDDYYSFKGADKEACYKAGREWLAKWDFKHEWTFTPGQPILEQMNNMKLALKGSPQCVAVYAWVSNDKGVYYSLGEPNHWTTVYNIDQYLKIFDSYSPIKKDVDQSILYCKRYSITKKNELTAEQVSGFQKILNWIAEQLGIIQKKINNLPKVDNSIEPKPQEVYNEVKESMKSKLNDFCLAIRDYEGKPGDLNYKNNNPGNIRGRNGNFLKFATMEEGFDYLKAYVKRAATGEHRAYKNGCTIAEFFKVYAPTGDNNNPDAYAKWVAKRISETVNTRVVDII